MQFRLWLENIEATPPSQFIGPDGMLNLFHFTSDRGETTVLDPKLSKPNKHSMREFRTAGTPRTFYYLDITDKESFISGIPYLAKLPATRIYNLLNDPLGIKKLALPDFDRMFELVREAGYVGVYYKPPQGHVVAVFDALPAVKIANAEAA